MLCIRHRVREVRLWEVMQVRVLSTLSIYSGAFPRRGKTGWCFGPLMHPDPLKVRTHENSRLSTDMVLIRWKSSFRRAVVGVEWLAKQVRVAEVFGEAALVALFFMKK